MIKNAIKKILGIYNFDREAEIAIKKSIAIYHGKGKINHWRGIKKYNKIRSQYNCDIWPGINFGENNYIAHPNNIIIGKTASIGSNCKIYPNCQLIASLKNDVELWNNHMRRHPKIMDNVIIGCGAIIIGPITIGNNVTIGAGAIVTKDVPDNTIVTGINNFKNK